MAKYSFSVMREFMNITRALADEHRVRALLALRKGELCGLAPSTVSKHLSILSQAGLVESRKEGRWIYYKLPGKHAPLAVREAIAWVGKALNGNARVAEDSRTLKRILKQDPVELCRKQCHR